MSIVKVKCRDQMLVVTEAPRIASGGIYENTIQFEFCDMWNGYEKIGVFYNVPYKPYKNVITENGSCIIPPEVTAIKGTMYFGVVGVNGDGITRTSEMIAYHICEGANDTRAVISNPTPEIWQQCLAEIAKAMVATQEARDEVGKVVGMAEAAEKISKNHAKRHAQNGEDPLTPEDIGAAEKKHEHDFKDINNHEHAQSHAKGGTDEIKPSDIGAAEKTHEHKASDIKDFPTMDRAYVSEDGKLHIIGFTAGKEPGGAVSDEQIAAAVEAYLKENPPEGGGGTSFEVDETLSLEGGVLSVKTTSEMSEDNTLPITSAGVYAVVGNIDALLGTI